MSNRAWMPLHIDDYITDTDHLTATEHGAYLLLIMKYWRDGGLPADEGMIRRFAKLTPEQWAESRDVIAAFFDDGWRHGRIDAELAKADEIIEKRRTAGKSKGGKSKSSANADHVMSNTPSICQDTRVPPLTNNLSSSLRSEEQPRALDPEFLESRLVEAVGDKIQPHGSLVVGPIMELLAAGADLDLDVLPAIRAAAARLSKPARSWGYFVPAIQDAFDRRKAAGHWEKAQPPPAGVPRMTAHQQRHHAAMAAFDKKLGVPPNDEFAGNTIDLAERDFSAH